ncbi:MAG: hypothetical protein AAGI01_04385 [Myxococcota bacterium]
MDWLFGLVFAGGLLYAAVEALKSRVCAACGHPLPKFRNPANLRQAMWGGWTCPVCHAELDRKANVLVAATKETSQLRGGLSESAPEGGGLSVTGHESGGLEQAEHEIGSRRTPRT